VLKKVITCPDEAWRFAGAEVPVGPVAAKVWEGVLLAEEDMAATNSKLVCCLFQSMQAASFLDFSTTNKLLNN
jgi:hypothetical protein